jgi:glucose-1-phosphate adenylyltransferase
VHGCDIDNSMISEGCILNGVYARNSIFGLRSRVDKGSRIENSIIMGSDFFESIEEIQKNMTRQVPPIGIGQNTVIRRAIIDKNTRIGSNVQLVNRDDVETADGENGCYYIREGIIIVPKNATVRDGMVI